MTLEEIERACRSGRPLDFSRHELEPDELRLKGIFYPYGFPVVVSTNSAEVLELVGELWGRFEKQHDTEPIRSAVYLVEDDSTACPPAPSYRFLFPLMMSIANGTNYGIVDLERKSAQISISRAGLRHRLYAKYFLLGTPVCCISTLFTTPIHAACIAWKGCGVLLCGDSGAGKSSLSYASARAGWTYISDDATYLLNGGTERRVIGDCHQVRLRPTATALFPELRGLEITPRAAGKPSIEMPTASLPNMICSETATVDFIVFLNRRDSDQPRLLPYRKDVARYFMQQVLFGSVGSRAAQYRAIDRLLEVDVFEMRYTEMDWAIDRLQKLVQEGR